MSIKHNRHKNKNNNHPKPIKKLIDERSKSYSPNSIGGRIDLEYLRDKLFCEELEEIKKTNQTNHNNNVEKDSSKSLQGKGEKK
jgi:hypothetical protein